MKYKILVWVTVISFLITTVAFGESGEFLNNKEIITVDSVHDQAKHIVEYVIGGTVSNKEANEEITRDEFVSAVVRLMKVGVPKTKEYLFRDVGTQLANADRIYSALELGWIAYEDTFRPKDSILYEEAVKIAVTALGYNSIAKLNGGYPTGYFLRAKEIGVLKNINKEMQTLTIRDAYVMLHNILNTNMLEQVSFGETKKYKKSDDTVLYSLYKISAFEGVVTSTPFNSIIDTDSNQAKNIISVNGVLLRFNDVNEDMLGLNYNIYCHEENGDMYTVIFLFPKGNEEYITPLRNSSVPEGNVMTLSEDNGKDKRFILSSSYTLIYNGKKCEDKKSEYFTGNSGNVRLVDNDSDGYYDIVFVQNYQYMIIGNIDVDNHMIGGMNGNGALDLSDSDCRYSIYDYESSKNLTFEQLKCGIAISVSVSLDGNLVKIINYSKMKSGTINSVSISERKVTVDNEEYYLSDYFMENLYITLRPGIDGNFYVGEDNDLVDIRQAKSDFYYGYLLDASVVKGIDSKVWLKIFSQDGVVEMIPVIKKPFIDGEKLTVEFADYIESAQGSVFYQPQLIKYKITNGKIENIDLANISTVESPVDYYTVRPDDNNLTQYSFNNYVYRSSSMEFAPYFSVEMSTVFYIPADMEEKKFKIKRNTGFINGKDYVKSGDTILPYDIDETGNAGAVVLIESGTTIPYQTSKTFFVEKISYGIDADGEDVKLLYVWESGKLKKYYVYNEVSLIKPSGKMLSCGDVITLYSPHSDIVTKLNLDFDSDPAVFAKGSSTNFNEDVQKSDIMYSGGRVYSAGTSYMVISCSTDNYGHSDFAQNNLRTFYLNSSSLKSIMVYDKARNTIRSGTTNDIKTYLAYGTDASYVVIRQYLGLVQAVLIYV